jgi:hypothetical protein
MAREQHNKPKTFTVPITCKELQLLLFVGWVVMGIYGVTNIEIIDGKFSALAFGATVIGFTGLLVHVIIVIVVYEDKIPRFKCRCDK